MQASEESANRPEDSADQEHLTLNGINRFHLILHARLIVVAGSMQEDIIGTHEIALYGLLFFGDSWISIDAQGVKDVFQPSLEILRARKRRLRRRLGVNGQPGVWDVQPSVFRG